MARTTILEFSASSHSRLQSRSMLVSGFYSGATEHSQIFKQGVPNEKTFKRLHDPAWRRDGSAFTGRFHSVCDRHAKIDKVLSKRPGESDLDSYRRGRDCPRRTHCDDLVVYLLSWGRSERQTR